MEPHVHHGRYLFVPLHSPSIHDRDDRDSDLFTDLEKLVMDYAAAISSTPARVPDSLFDQLRANLGDTALIELTHHIALENMRGRFNVAFGVGAAGYSEGMVCAVPASVASNP